jgi:hypothetical protein
LATPTLRGDPGVIFRRFGDVTHQTDQADWLWDRLLARGQLTLLAAAAKAGKSTLMFGLLSAMHVGGSLLGRRVEPGRALLLSEESVVTLEDKSIAFDLAQSGHEYVSREGGVFVPGWHALIDQAAQHAVANDQDLLVVDTFSTLAGLEPEHENDAAAVNERLDALHRASSMGLAVLLLHHVNVKGNPRGSTAFSAAPDTVVRMRTNKSTGRITLIAEGRRTALLTLKGRLDRERWTYESSPRREPEHRHTDTSPTDASLVAALKQAGPNGLTYSEIDAIPGLSAHKAKKRFPDWAKKGMIRPVGGTGRRGDPLRWVLRDSMR